MLSQIKIIEYAIKGISKEIEELDKDVRRGFKYIQQIENGEKPKTPKTKYEIIEICYNKNAEIEKLEKYRADLKWQLAELEE